MLNENLILTTGLPEPYFEFNFRAEPPGWNLKEHDHPYHQLIYVISGCLHVQLANQEYSPSAGQVCLIPPGVRHTLQTFEGYSQFGVNFQIHSDARGIVGLLDTYIVKFILLDKPSLLDTVPQLQRETQKLTQVSRIKTASILDSIIISCIEDLTDPKESGFRMQLVSLLNRHLAEDVKLEQVVKELAISQTHLERLSNKEFGCSVMELFHRMKLNQACSLLMERNRNINEIAQQIGHHDAAYFCRFFKRRMQMTPGEYRKKFCV